MLLIEAIKDGSLDGLKILLASYPRARRHIIEIQEIYLKIKPICNVLECGMAPLVLYHLM